MSASEAEFRAPERELDLQKEVIDCVSEEVFAFVLATPTRGEAWLFCLHGEGERSRMLLEIWVIRYYK